MQKVEYSFYFDVTVLFSTWIKFQRQTMYYPKSYVFFPSSPVTQHYLASYYHSTRIKAHTAMILK